MKKFILFFVLLMGILPVLADESPNAEAVKYYNSQSGAFSRNINMYGLNRAVVNRTENVNDDDEVVLDAVKPEKKVIKQRKISEDNVTSSQNSDKRTPMTYEQFPKNYDSSNSMMMMPGGIGGMMPGMF